MKIITQCIIEGKQAKLLLLSDNKTLKVVLDNKVVRVMHGVWENIKDEDWAQEATLRIVVTDYIRKKATQAELEALAKLYF